MQCFGITKAGSQCRRTTNSLWCWQHLYQSIIPVAVVVTVVLLVIS